MKKNRILALSLSTLGLSQSYIEDVAEFIFAERNPEWEPGSGAARRRNLGSLVNKLTIGDLLQAYESASISPRHQNSVGRYLMAHSGQGRINTVTILSKLAELGLENSDWSFMPTPEMTPKELKRIPKKALLQKPALILHTLTYPAARAVANELEMMGISRDGDTMTVADLLRVPDAGKPVSRSLEKTRHLLRWLGFRYEDGPLLQFRTRRSITESLMKEEGVSAEEASLIARIAEKRSWVGPFVADE